MAKEMGLDRAPIEFWKLVFLVPPNVHVLYMYIVHTCIDCLSLQLQLVKTTRHPSLRCADWVESGDNWKLPSRFLQPWKIVIAAVSAITSSWSSVIISQASSSPSSPCSSPPSSFSLSPLPSPSPSTWKLRLLLQDLQNIAIWRKCPWCKEDQSLRKLSVWLFASNCHRSGRVRPLAPFVLLHHLVVEHHL